MSHKRTDTGSKEVLQVSETVILTLKLTEQMMNRRSMEFFEN